MNQLACDLDVPPSRISAIVNGTRAITADSALRLGAYFGVSPEPWLGLQVEYDLRVAKLHYGEEIARRVRTRPTV
jgi:addiction module HigA family antidote